MMRKVKLFFAIAVLGGGFLASQAGVARAVQKPDFTGSWELDATKSDDAEQKIRAAAGESGGRRPRRGYLRQAIDRLTSLAKALDVIEIEHTAREFKIFENIRFRLTLDALASV